MWDEFCEMWVDIWLCMIGLLHPTKQVSTWHEGFFDYWTDRDFGDESD